MATPETLPHEKLVQRVERTAQIAKGVDVSAMPETWKSSEEGAEQLYALWRDAQRLRTSRISTVQEKRKTLEALRERQSSEIDSALQSLDSEEEKTKKREELGREHEKQREKIKEDDGTMQRIETRIAAAIRRRYEVPEIQTLFRKKVEDTFAAEKRTQPTFKDWEDLQKKFQDLVARRNGMYRDTFQNRDREMDELTSLEMDEISMRVPSLEKAISTLETENPELASRISFDRIKRYRQQLEKGFAWTESRDKYFTEIVDHLVRSGRNVILLTGETGTGKTRIARTAAERLTGKPPFEVGGEAKNNISPLLGVRAMEGGESYVIYGPLGQALTGKKTSRDKTAGRGGIFYMDEMNDYPPDALRALIKQVAGRQPGEEIGFAAWYGEREKIAPDFALIGSANLPSEKHADRAEFPKELVREIKAIDIDYLPQTPENPELYEAMLAALMDQNDRIRLPASELTAAWYEETDVAKGVKRHTLDRDGTHGGTLWRFANCVAEIQKSYKGKEKGGPNIFTEERDDRAYLKTALLDVGVALSWLKKFRTSKEKDLQTFLSKEIETWSSQDTFPKEDREFLHEFQKAFHLLKRDEHEPLPAPEILTPFQIGELSPRVPRREIPLTADITPTEQSLFKSDGTAIAYRPEVFGTNIPGTFFIQKSDGTEWVYKGLTAAGNVVVEGPVAQDPKELPQIDFGTQFENVNADVILERTPEGGPVRVEIEKILGQAKKFYEDHHLPECARVIPKDIQRNKKIEQRIREALRQGFTEITVLPGSDLQESSLNALFEHLGKTPAPTLPEEQQYKNDVFYSEEDLAEAKSSKRPKKPYLLLYRSSDASSSTKEKSPIDLREEFRSRTHVGLTIPEYFVLQRKEAEQRGNHTFDQSSNDPKESHWMWLLDTKVEEVRGQKNQVEEPQLTAHACWDPEEKRIRILFDASENADPRIGAIEAIIIELP